MQAPTNISQFSWNAAYYALSKGFTVSIENRLNEVIVLAQNIDALKAYAYKFVTWEEFIAAEDKPDGLIDRAIDWRQDHPQDGLFVVYDPIDDEDGFLLMASDPMELARLTCEYIRDMEPEEGPLGVDTAAQNAVEAG